jgi:hypothetical protein
MFLVGGGEKGQPLLALYFEYGVGFAIAMLGIGIEDGDMGIIKGLGDKSLIRLVGEPKSHRDQREHH